MEKYFYFWLFFISISAIWHGYKNYKANQDIGFNEEHFKNTGQVVRFDGGTGETISCTIAAALGLILSPTFLVMETLKFIPAAFFLHLIS